MELRRSTKYFREKTPYVRLNLSPRLIFILSNTHAQPQDPYSSAIVIIGNNGASVTRFSLLNHTPNLKCLKVALLTFIHANNPRNENRNFSSIQLKKISLEVHCVLIVQGMFLCIAQFIKQFSSSLTFGQLLLLFH